VVVGPTVTKVKGSLVVEMALRKTMVLGLGLALLILVAVVVGVLKSLEIQSVVLAVRVWSFFATHLLIQSQLALV